MFSFVVTTPASLAISVAVLLQLEATHKMARLSRVINVCGRPVDFFL